MKVNVIKWMNIIDTVEKDKEMLNAFMKFYEKLKEVINGISRVMSSKYSILQTS